MKSFSSCEILHRLMEMRRRKPSGQLNTLGYQLAITVMMHSWCPCSLPGKSWAKDASLEIAFNFELGQGCRSYCYRSRIGAVWHGKSNPSTLHSSILGSWCGRAMSWMAPYPLSSARWTGGWAMWMCQSRRLVCVDAQTGLFRQGCKIAFSWLCRQCRGVWWRFSRVCRAYY